MIIIKTVFCNVTPTVKLLQLHKIKFKMCAWFWQQMVRILHNFWIEESQYLTRQTRDVDPVLVRWWSTVYDAGPTLPPHWVNIPCLLGILWQVDILVSSCATPWNLPPVIDPVTGTRGGGWPTNTRYWNNNALMLCQRRRRWHNINASLF